MKSFKPINIVPIQVNTLGDNADSPEIVALKQVFNDKLREVAEKTNDAIDSLTAGTLDIGLWSSGEVVTINGGDAVDGHQDLAVFHHLDTRPRYWLVLDQSHHSTIENEGGDADVSAQKLLRGVTTWTDTLVYFRVPTTGRGTTGAATYKVLLIP